MVQVLAILGKIWSAILLVFSNPKVGFAIACVCLVFGFSIGRARGYRVGDRSGYRTGYNVGFTEGAAGKPKKIWPNLWRSEGPPHVLPGEDTPTESVEASADGEEPTESAEPTTETSATAPSDVWIVGTCN